MESLSNFLDCFANFEDLKTFELFFGNQSNFHNIVLLNCPFFVFNWIKKNEINYTFEYTPSFQGVILVDEISKKSLHSLTAFVEFRKLSILEQDALNYSMDSIDQLITKGINVLTCELGLNRTLKSTKDFLISFSNDLDAQCRNTFSKEELLNKYQEFCTKVNVKKPRQLPALLQAVKADNKYSYNKKTKLYEKKVGGMIECEYDLDIKL